MKTLTLNVGETKFVIQAMQEKVANLKHYSELYPDGGWSDEAVRKAEKTEAQILEKL